ncbi:helix-turn-helix transcriptional regulator [Streptomyces sp. NPDC096079]|uniref:helix-turn-helix domain-containing protein n=1 Tax=Streptomyces sp. NPDC096079 TaxID=3155820 RepID=UPI0033337A50
MTAQGPRRLQIAKGLAELRTRSGLTLEDVAKAAGYGKSTVQRYEDWTAKAKPKARTVRLIAEAAGGTPEEVAALTKLAESLTDGWWAVGGAVPEWLHPLVSLEQEAEEETAFAPSVIPGLLQTREYAMAVHLGQEVREPLDGVTRQVDSRIKRQEVLNRPAPLHLWAVLDEGVLKRQVGNTAVMAAQLDHLIEQTQRRHINIQVLPLATGAHAAAGVGHFVTITSGGITSAYAELLGGGLYMDTADQVRRYTTAMDYLRSQAADTDASLKILSAYRKEYDA